LTAAPSAIEAETVLRRVLAEEGHSVPVTKIAVETPAQAVTTGFLGSPTVRVNGRDIEPARADEPGGAMSCRLYRTEQGESGVPPDALPCARVRTAARSNASGDDLHQRGDGAAARESDLMTGVTVEDISASGHWPVS